MPWTTKARKAAPPFQGGCIQEINIGMVADVGTLQRLPKLIPLAVVKELAYRAGV